MTPTPKQPDRWLEDALFDLVLVGLPKDCAMIAGKIICPSRDKAFSENRNPQYEKANSVLLDRLEKDLLNCLPEKKDEREIAVNGPTFSKLLEQAYWENKIIDQSTAAIKTYIVGLRK